MMTGLLFISNTPELILQGYVEMTKGERTKSKIVEEASRLFRTQGFSATGLKQIIEESGTPRGSLYYHFPGGKEELAREVVEQHTEEVVAQMRRAFKETSSAMEGLARLLDEFATQADLGECESGCPVMAISVEAASVSPELRDAARQAFERWRSLLTAHLVVEGFPDKEASALARSLVSMLEGAQILARAYGDGGPIRDLRSSLGRLLPT